MMSKTEEIFTRIIKSRYWGGGDETPCGPGSTLAATLNLRTAMVRWFETYDIRSIIDLGCGDCNWIFDVLSAGGRPCEYKGYDIVLELIVQAIGTHRMMITPNCVARFCQADITQIVYPYADFAICKEVMIHLPTSDCLTILDKVRNAGCKYLAASSFPHYLEPRKPVEVGSWGALNLEREPFNLGKPLDKVKIDVPSPEAGDLYLMLWKMKEGARG